MKISVVAYFLIKIPTGTVSSEFFQIFQRSYFKENLRRAAYWITWESHHDAFLLYISSLRVVLEKLFWKFENISSKNPWWCIFF